MQIWKPNVFSRLLSVVLLITAVSASARPTTHEELAPADDEAKTARPKAEPAAAKEEAKRPFNPTTDEIWQDLISTHSKLRARLNQLTKTIHTQLNQKPMLPSPYLQLSQELADELLRILDDEEPKMVAMHNDPDRPELNDHRRLMREQQVPWMLRASATHGILDVLATYAETIHGLEAIPGHPAKTGIITNSVFNKKGNYEITSDGKKLEMTSLDIWYLAAKRLPKAYTEQDRKGSIFWNPELLKYVDGGMVTGAELHKAVDEKTSLPERMDWIVNRVNDLKKIHDAQKAAAAAIAAAEAAKAAGK